MEKLFYPLLCIRQNPPRQPTTFTLLAAAAAAATTAATASHCHSRRSPFFGALNYRPELQNSGLERVVCTRVYAGKWNTVSYDPGWAGGARREDGRKFATSSLMLLKQKTPASTEPVRVASRATPLSRRGVGPSFLPSFRPSYPVYFPCCPSSTFVKRRTSLNPALSPPVLLILLVAPSYRASP